MKILSKIALRIPEQGAYLCLLFISAAFEKVDFHKVEQHFKYTTLSLNKNTEPDLNSEQQIANDWNKESQGKTEDVVMENEEAKLSIQQLASQFTSQVDQLFNHFVIGSSRKLREVSSLLLKHLWYSVYSEIKIRIFKILMSKFSYLHSYEIKATEFLPVIIQILNEHAENETSTEFGINTADILNYIKYFL